MVVLTNRFTDSRRFNHKLDICNLGLKRGFVISSGTEKTYTYFAC